MSERPEVTLHFAQSLDGRIGYPRGQRLHLSSGEGLRLAHHARASHDAVLVGVGTVLNDDPLLSVRHVAGPQPRRVVLDSSLRLPDSARVLSSEGGPLTVFAVAGVVGVEARAEQLRARGVDVELTEADDAGRVCVHAALRALRRRGVATLLVEGGALTLTSFLKQRVADRVSIELLPFLVGEPALQAFGEVQSAARCPGPHVTLPELSIPRLCSAKMEELGGSWMIRGQLAYGDAN